MEAKERKEEDPQIIAGKLFDSVRDTLLKQGVLQRMKVQQPVLNLGGCVGVVVTRTCEISTCGFGARVCGLL